MRNGPDAEIVLLVPGLLGPEAPGADPAGFRDPDAARALVDGLEIGALDRLLARAEFAAGNEACGSYEALVLGAFGYPVPAPDMDWPVAAFTALIDLDPGERRALLRADPVHLRADIADLVLFDATDAEISFEEARSLADTVNSALHPHGPLVYAAHPRRWYLAPDAPARIATTPLSRAARGPITPTMPRGPDAPRWHRWMNEVQMALHQCPVNAARERRGAAPINSLWPWGGGTLPPPAATSFAGAWSDDVLVHGLALHAGVERGAMPDDADRWIEDAAGPGMHLVACDALNRAARGLDLDAWRGELARFSRSWAEPLLVALDRGRVERVSIRDERGHRFVAARRARFRWRRQGGLAARIAAASGANGGDGGG